MNHIIIEGPDGGGKTVLAHELRRQRGYAYHHEGPPPACDSLLGYYTDRLLEARHPTVFDRFHLGELVYGPLLRGGARLTLEEVRLLHRVLRARGAQLVLALPSWATTQRNRQGRRELFTDEALHLAAYGRWLKLLPLFDVVFNHDQMTCRSFVRSLPLRRPTCPPGVMGSPTARLLVVGEQVNCPDPLLTRVDPALELPFYATSRSSGFFNECLQRAGLDEIDLAFTNALTLTEGPRNLKVIVAALPTLRAVALLGQTALAEWERQGGHVGPYAELIPHPAYWRRFHAKEPDAYVARLRALARRLADPPATAHDGAAGEPSEPPHSGAARPSGSL